MDDDKPIGARLEQAEADAAGTAQAGLREELRRYWRVMTFYERFEQLIALILSGVIAVVIVVAVIELIEIVALILVNEPLNPMQSDAFQLVFGIIMTLLIARIALARKFVIPDADTSPGKIAALAGALLALGIACRLVRGHDAGESG